MSKNFEFNKIMRFRTWAGQERAIKKAVKRMIEQDPANSWDSSKFIRSAIVEKLQAMKLPITIDKEVKKNDNKKR